MNLSLQPAATSPAPTAFKVGTFGAGEIGE